MFTPAIKLKHFVQVRKSAIQKGICEVKLEENVFKIECNFDETFFALGQIINFIALRFSWISQGLSKYMSLFSIL